MSTIRSAALPTWKIWLQGIRPRTLVAGCAPVILGAAVAWHSGSFRPAAAWLALLGAICLQTGANLANDAADGMAGIDGSERVGPRRLVQSGLASAKQVGRATAFAFGLAAVAGLGLITLAGWPILVIGLAAILAAIAYSAGPAPLSRLGLGEVVAFLFFGPVAVLGTYGATTGHWSGLPLGWVMPPGLLAAALMLANNARDRQTDAAAGKRTLAVRLGEGPARLLYVLAVVGALAVPTAIGFEHADVAIVAGALMAVPAALRAVKLVLADLEGRALAPLLGRTVDLLAVSTLTLTVGIL
ncbi:MAG: 1,4-dihydroxy-2-naphthoate polyprenyltransferase, partial [Cyanobacteria bacterium REEB65]|nr:1,4-dihydroxy-2-naphthoate polyprenyltransferase [Cyanobacteria bacterium REEB65]